MIVACIDFDWKGMGVNVAEYIANNYPGEKLLLSWVCLNLHPSSDVPGILRTQSRRIGERMKL